MKQIAIIGGGSAGVMFANRMRKEFTEDEVELTVIEKSDKHYYQPAYTLLVFDLDEPENIVKPTNELFFEGVNLVQDEAVKINPKENTVTTTKHGDISYDYLVIATGAKLALGEPEGMLEGLKKGENVHNFYTMDGALRLRDAIKNCDGGTIVSTFVEMPIKCPAAPIKFILMAEDTMRNLGKRNKFKFVLTTPMPSAFSRHPYMEKLNDIFESRGIETVANFAPGEVDHEKGVMKSYTGQEVNFDLLSITPPHEGADVIQNSDGVGDAAGWVTCDKYHMLSKYHDNIYGIGDATDFPTSKTASGARKQAKVLTERFKAILKGQEPKTTYDGEIICPILTKNKRAIFANFNYDKSLSPASESYLNWVLKVNMLRPLYWNLMLKGLL